MKGFMRTPIPSNLKAGTYLGKRKEFYLNKYVYTDITRYLIIYGKIVIILIYSLLSHNEDRITQFER